MFIITLFLFLASQPVSASTNLSCNGYPKSYSISFNSEIILVKFATEDKTLEELISSSIIFQNQYVYPEMPMLLENKGMFLWGGFEKKDIDFTVTKKEEIKLPYSIEVDSKIPAHYPKPVLEYLNKILSRNKIEKDESALKVSYKAKIKIDLCQKKDEVLQQLSWPLPKEPYLAYFLIPKSKRLELKNKINERAITNPCASRNQIGSQGFIDPWSYWFFWSPRENGIDSNDKPFNCSNLITEKVHWEDPKPKMELLATSFATLKAKKTPLKMSFLYSAFQYRNFKSYAESDKNTITAIVKNLIISADKQDSIGQIQTSLKNYDPALTAAMMLLWNLKRNSVFKKYAINMNDSKVEIIVRGILKLSLKPYEIKFFISPNQPDHSGHGDFKFAMSNALLKDDVVVYTGHAGFGSYLISSLQDVREKMVASKDIPQYQFVALFSCASNLYYPEEYFSPPPEATFRRDFVHAIASLNDATSIGATLVLGIIDQSMRQDKVPSFKDWVKIARYDNFLKLKTVEKKNE
jgi:hypothetical protein